MKIKIFWPSLPSIVLLFRSVPYLCENTKIYCRGFAIFINKNVLSLKIKIFRASLPSSGSVGKIFHLLPIQNNCHKYKHRETQNEILHWANTKTKTVHITVKSVAIAEELSQIQIQGNTKSKITSDLKK